MRASAMTFKQPALSAAVPPWIAAICTLGLLLATQTTAFAQQCLSVTDSEPVPSTESRETMKGQCPIRKCFGESCSCYDRLYTTEVVNTCQNEIKIEVDAGTNYSSGQHKLGKGQHEKYSCQEARDGCRGVKVSFIGQETETTNQFRPNPPKNQAVSPADLDAAKKRADAARARAELAKKEQADKKDAQEDEKKKLKESALKLPSFCEGMIHACEQRIASLPNLTDETRSQCNAYCMNLRIENCDPSSTIKDGAQACNAGAERDQKAAVERARTAKEQQARAEAEERRKWHCFGEYGNIEQGFEQCQRECSTYFSSAHCHSACYASGDGSVRNGRSCYREP